MIKSKFIVLDEIPGSEKKFLLIECEEQSLFILPVPNLSAERLSDILSGLNFTRPYIQGIIKQAIENSGLIVKRIVINGIDYCHEDAEIVFENSQKKLTCSYQTGIAMSIKLKKPLYISKRMLNTPNCLNKDRLRPEEQKVFDMILRDPSNGCFDLLYYKKNLQEMFSDNKKW